jgi:signal transduction histidine kinase
METFLRQIETDYGRGALDIVGDDTLISAIGHQCKDLRAWGVLDSVLRMVQAPKDLFAQPERFLSYFVSPAPPVGEVRRGPESVSFVLPVSEMQFPLVTGYLRAALEGLPTYINKPMATVIWQESRVAISWSENQASLFGDSQNAELSLHPELVRNILINLETSQSELEEMKRQVHAKNQEIESLKSDLSTRVNSTSDVNSAGVPDLSSLARGLAQEIDEPVAGVLNDLYKLGDYFARGQQLITLLIGQGRQTKQVQEAMRRVDWEHVTVDGPVMVKRVVRVLQQVQETARLGRVVVDDVGPKVVSDLGGLITSAIETIQLRYGEIQVEKHFLLERLVPVFPNRIEQAIVNIISNTIEAMRPGSVVRIVTRPLGSRAQIEVSRFSEGTVDMTSRKIGPLFAASTMTHMTAITVSPAASSGTPTTDAVGHGLSIAQSIVQMHNGTLSVYRDSEFDSRVVVELPID